MPHDPTQPHCTCVRCLMESFFGDIQSQLPLVILGPDRADSTKPTTTTDTRYDTFEIDLHIQREGRRVIKINGIPLIGTYDPTEARAILTAIQITLSIYKKHLLHTGRMGPTTPMEPSKGHFLIQGCGSRLCVMGAKTTGEAEARWRELFPGITMSRIDWVPTKVNGTPAQ